MFLKRVVFNLDFNGSNDGNASLQLSKRKNGYVAAKLFYGARVQKIWTFEIKQSFSRGQAAAETALDVVPGGLLLEDIRRLAKVFVEMSEQPN